MNKNKIFLPLLTASVVAALNGCSGGGGGSTPPASTATTGSSMTVSPSLGRFKNAAGNAVSVKLINASGVVVQTATLNDTTGQAIFTNLASSLGTLVIEISGGEYFDEAVGTYKPTGINKLRAVVDKPYSGITVSPLTHAAAKRLVDESASGVVTLKSGKTATEVLTENNLEGQRFGVSNPLLLKPVLVGDEPAQKISGTDDIESQKYAAVLAGLAVAAKNAGVSPATLAEELAKDLSDGVIDGKSGATAIAVDAAKVAAFVTDITTSLDENSNTVITSLVDTTETLIALQTAVTSSVQVGTQLTEAEITAATTQAQVAATAGDSLSQARQFFASLRTGITPYATAQGTGYTQTAVKNIEAEFATFASATVSSRAQVEAIAQATYNVTNQMEGIPAPMFQSGTMMCRSDAASVTSGLYEAGTTFAALCRVMTQMPVAGTTDYDQIVYLVYTSAPSYTGGALDASFKWVGRVDRYGADNIRKIKGVGANGLADDTNRRKGTFSAKELVVTSSTGETGTIALNAFKGQLWPIINNSAVTTTDGTDVDLTVTGSFASAWDSNGVWTKDAVDFQMNGKLTSYAGSTTLATLEFGSSTGSTSVVKADLVNPGATDTAGLKVTLTTAKTQISGDVSVVGFTSKPGAPYTYFQYVGMGNGNYSCCYQTTSIYQFTEVAPGAGEFIKVTETPTESNINELKFAGLVKDLLSGTTVFEGSIAASANYANYDPAKEEGTTNYVAGVATVIGKLKKSVTDTGLSLTAILTATGYASDAKQWQVSYVDASGLKVSGNFTAADQSATLSNSANPITVVLYKTPELNSATNKYVDGKVMTGTTQLGIISGSMVTYADGLTETIY